MGVSLGPEIPEIDILIHISLILVYSNSMINSSGIYNSTIFCWLFCVFSVSFCRLQESLDPGLIPPSVLIAGYQLWCQFRTPGVTSPIDPQCGLLQYLGLYHGFYYEMLRFWRSNLVSSLLNKQTNLWLCVNVGVLKRMVAMLNFEKLTSCKL